MTRYSNYQALFGDLAIIPESGFDLWVKKSIAEIDTYITVPIAEIKTENAQLCIFEVAESLYKSWEKSGIKSENTDGYSVTYDAKEQDICSIIRKYLGEYCYRGVEI